VLENLSEDLDFESMSMELGLCMIDASNPYAAELKRDYEIDMKNIDEQGEELGSIIGVRMASVCPMQMLEIANKLEEDVTADLESVLEGKVIAIADDQVVELSIQDDQGSVSQVYFLW
jgi:hypothetical protein